MLRDVGLRALPGSILFLANVPAHAYPADFCYERSHFALMVARDRDKIARKESEQSEEYAKSAWSNLLLDHTQREIDRHIDIIVTAWEVMQGQTPDQIEAITLQDCMKRSERYL
ncbi:hypothetical protein PQR37_26000 [Paraburkholderia nemoris]|uniref:hypothetical protein n=1 Tax=Paraburkholderia nemoris TaxID=2793076 RepID=UPI0038B82802